MKTKRIELLKKILNDKNDKIKAFFNLIEILPFKTFLQLIREIRRQKENLIKEFESSDKVKIDITSQYNYKGIDINIEVFSIETIRKRDKKIIHKVWNTLKNIKLLKYLPYIKFRFLAETKEKGKNDNIIEVGDKNKITKFKDILSFSIDINEIVKRKKEIFSEFFTKVKRKNNLYLIGYYEKIRVKLNIVDFCYLSNSQFRKLLNWIKEFIENNKEKGKAFSIQLSTNQISSHSYFSLDKGKNCIQVMKNKEFYRVYYYYTDLKSNYKVFQKYLEKNPLRVNIITYGYGTVWNLELNLKEE